MSYLSVTHPTERLLRRLVEYVATKLDPKIDERVAACAYEFGTDRDHAKPGLWVVPRDELLQRVEQVRP